jgi:hypothetical protein
MLTSIVFLENAKPYHEVFFMREEEKRGLCNFAWDVFKTSGNIESYLLYNKIHTNGSEADFVQELKQGGQQGGIR